ncbi:MAG: hypothetical protein ACOYJ6_02605 [Caulobacterales bacterium]|jgi:hypothetical protein
MPSAPDDSSADAMFERALDIAARHLDSAVAESDELADWVAVAMIEAAVNRAVDGVGHADVAGILRDLADQIEADDEGDADDE